MKGLIVVVETFIEEDGADHVAGSTGQGESRVKGLSWREEKTTLTLESSSACIRVSRRWLPSSSDDTYILFSLNFFKLGCKHLLLILILYAL